jgi:hypothetical protein
MRDSYGDVVFAVMPKPPVVKIDNVKATLETLDPVMRAQRDWFRENERERQAMATMPSIRPLPLVKAQPVKATLIGRVKSLADIRKVLK